jgi:hypothetical protein
MGCDTHGKLKGYIKPEEVLNFIRQKWDQNARNCVEVRHYGNLNDLKFSFKKTNENDTEWLVESGFITFKVGDEDRMLHYSHDNIITFDNLQYYSNVGLEEIVLNDTTSLSLGLWGSSIEIMKEIVAQFGGWVDENDCDDEEYYPISKNDDGSIKPVIRVTIEDIEKLYGGTVIITK